MEMKRSLFFFFFFFYFFCISTDETLQKYIWCIHTFSVMDPLITTCDVVTEELVVVKMSSLKKKETVNTECIQKCSIDSKVQTECGRKRI